MGVKLRRAHLPRVIQDIHTQRGENIRDPAAVRLLDLLLCGPNVDPSLYTQPSVGIPVLSKAEAEIARRAKA